MKRRTRREFVLIFTGNTIVMIATIAVFYAIVIRGLSTNQMVVVVVLFTLLSWGWLMLLQRILGHGRSN